MGWERVSSPQWEEWFSWSKKPVGRDTDKSSASLGKEPTRLCDHGEGILFISQQEDVRSNIYHRMDKHALK